MTQPVITCPHCGQSFTLAPAQTAVARESAKYVQTIEAEHRTGGLITGNITPGDTIPFMRHPGEQFYTAQDVQAIAAEYRETP